MKNSTIGAQDWGLILLLSLLWGGAFILTEVVLERLLPFTVVLGRVGFAAIALWAIALLAGHRFPTSLRLWGAFLIMGMLNNAVPFSLIVSGQTAITGGLAAVFNATTPLFSVVLAHFLTGEERITWNRLGGILLGVVGVGVLMGPEALAGLGEVGVGQLLVLGAALSYACAAIYGRRFRGLPPTVIAAGQVTCATFLILPLALFLDQPWNFSPTLATWGALLTLSLVGTAAAYMIYFRVLASAGATNLMLVTLLIPVSAIAMGVAFLGEPVGPRDLAGAAFILGGLLAIDGRLLHRGVVAVGRRIRPAARN